MSAKTNDPSASALDLAGVSEKGAAIIEAWANSREGDLYLNDAGLTSFPRAILTLAPHLKELSLTRNPIGALPDDLNELDKLTVLAAFDCGLHSLPESIGQLAKLKDLNVASNPLTSLPESLRNLKKLKKLLIQHTAIAELPDWFGELEQLQELWLTRTALRSLPASFAKLQSLTALYLGGTRLEEIPAPIFELRNLKTLELSDCKALKTISPRIGELRALKSLKLDNTAIESLPAAIADLTSLKELEVYNTPLKRLPPELARLTKLEAVNVYGTKLDNVPTHLVTKNHWPSLREELKKQLTSDEPTDQELSGEARYRQFIADKEFAQRRTLRVDHWSMPFSFGEASALRKRIASENTSFQGNLAEKFPTYEPLAMVDLTEEEMEDANDSELDEFLVVDTSKGDHPVLLFRHGSGFARLSPHFGHFLDEIEEVERDEE